MEDGQVDGETAEWREGGTEGWMGVRRKRKEGRGQEGESDPHWLATVGSRPFESLAQA